MNILYCTIEASPFIKRGGLADVMGNVPKVVAANGHTVSVILPKFSQHIPADYLHKMKYIGYVFVDVNWRHQYCGIYKLVENKVSYYFLENEFYFGGDIYNDDDMERFAFFSKACLDVAVTIDRQDIIHCNDWSCGMLPAYFQAEYRCKRHFHNTHIVYTIHNLDNQGIMDIEKAHDITGLSSEYINDGCLVHGYDANYVKAGIVCADAVTTISPTYAEEIASEPNGRGLSYVITNNQDKFTGILNGINTDKYNPSKDKTLALNYNKLTAEEGKAHNKSKLQLLCSLPTVADVPLIGIAMRLVEDKGIELVINSIDRLVELGTQIVIVGDGDSSYKDRLKQLMNKHYDNVYYTDNVNVSINKQVYAGSDIMLIPSLHEPCGSTQLKALKYGALPVVSMVGGLKDTVIDYSTDDVHGNGFMFGELNSQCMVDTIVKALGVFSDKAEWNKLVVNSMKSNFTWKVSVSQYLAIYGDLTGKETVVKPRVKRKYTRRNLDSAKAI